MDVSGLIGAHCDWEAFDTLRSNPPGQGMVVGGVDEQNLGACLLIHAFDDEGMRTGELKLVPFHHVTIRV